ncbi:MAG TPA: EI24 domain-containing protein [Reyranella sp.]|nr:EI24 domain-containing protein [Reyranella sp.]
MIRAFELAFSQTFGDAKLRAILFQSLALSLVLQVGLGALAWWAFNAYVHVGWHWVAVGLHWLGGGAIVTLALLLFPASFGIVVSVFLDAIADIVEGAYYPALGKARGTPFLTMIWAGIAFLVAVVVLNLLLLPVYLIALFVFGSGAILFYALNGWLTARLYYEQVALRRHSAAEVKAWRKANTLPLWLTGTAIVFLGTIPVLNLIVPVVGTAAMVHVAQTLKAPRGPGQPFHPPA